MRDMEHAAEVRAVAWILQAAKRSAPPEESGKTRAGTRETGGEAPRRDFTNEDQQAGRVHA